MSLTSIQKELLPIIESQLKKYFQSIDFGYSMELQEMIAYHMGWSDDEGSHGKRIRPLVVLLTTGAFGGRIKAALPAAIAIEYLHNFTLIHDDIEDDSPIRHRRKTLWKKWGLAQGINTGDALFCIAQLAMLDLEETCRPSTALKAIKAFNQTCLHLTRGQYLDIAFESTENINVETYLEMIQGKTAVLISLASRLGGLITDQKENHLAMLGEFGEALGMAFQIKDDYIGIWGDPKITGKSAVSDLVSKKKTLPVIFGLHHSDEFMKIWEKDEFSGQDLEEAANLLIKCDAQKFTQSKAEEFTNQAFSTLDKLFPQRNQYGEALFELTEMLLQRNY